MAKMPMLPGMGAKPPSAPMGNLPGAPMLAPGSKPKGKGGAKAGMPNFKSRITKPGGMKAGGAVKSTVKLGTIKAGAGSGVGRLQRSK